MRFLICPARVWTANFDAEDHYFFTNFIFSVVYECWFFSINIYHQLKLIFQALANNLYSLFEEATP